MADGAGAVRRELTRWGMTRCDAKRPPKVGTIRGEFRSEDRVRLSLFMERERGPEARSPVRRRRRTNSR